jgi:hypothetical protein
MVPMNSWLDTYYDMSDHFGYCKTGYGVIFWDGDDDDSKCDGKGDVGNFILRWCDILMYNNWLYRWVYPDY